MTSEKTQKQKERWRKKKWKHLFI